MSGVQVNPADCTPRMARLILASGNCPPSAKAALESILARSGMLKPSPYSQGSENAGNEDVASRRAIRGEPKGPNKTEARFNREVLGGRGLYEAITLRLPGGSRYTPDWVVVDEGRVMLFEVKSYRQPSEGRALTAFREARAAFPCFSFGWWVWTGGEWVEKHGKKKNRKGC